PKTGGQFTRRRLSSAGGTDQSGYFSLSGCKTYILQHAVSLPVCKGNMFKSNIIVCRCKFFHAFLHRLLQDRTHPLNLQLRIESGGDILKYQPQRVIQPCGSKEESQKVKKGKFSPCQQRSAGQDRSCQPKTEECLCGADKHAGGKF